MQRDVKIVRFAKRLVAMAQEDGVVREERVREILDALKENPPRHHARLLRAFLRHVRRELSMQTARVWSAGTLSEETVGRLEAYFSQCYERTVSAQLENDPSLIAGVRIRVGDDLYDASVAGRLQRLADAV